MNSLQFAELVGDELVPTVAQLNAEAELLSAFATSVMCFLRNRYKQSNTVAYADECIATGRTRGRGPEICSKWVAGAQMLTQL